MQCKQCGRESGSQTLCALCASGAPPSMVKNAPQKLAPQGLAVSKSPASSGSVAEQLSAAPPAASAASMALPGMAPPSSQPAQSNYDERPARREKPPRAPREPRVSSGERNLFALLGLTFAFFQPLLGIVFSVIGIAEAKNSGEGKRMAIGGLLLSIIILAAMILIIKYLDIAEIIVTLRG